MCSGWPASACRAAHSTGCCCACAAIKSVICPLPHVLGPCFRCLQAGPPAALHHAATPGFWGLLRDGMRLVLGTRILHIATVAVVLQLPVLATVAQQILVLFGSDNGGYCRSPLLSDPLTQRRMVHLASWLSTLLPGPLGLSLAGLAHGRGGAGEGAEWGGKLLATWRSGGIPSAGLLCFNGPVLGSVPHVYFPTFPNPTSLPRRRRPARNLRLRADLPQRHAGAASTCTAGRREGCACATSC